MEGEGKDEELVVAPTKPPAAADQISTAIIVPSTKQKKRGRLSLLRAMACMARRQSKKVATVQPEAVLPNARKKSLWKSLLGSVRPLHHPTLDGKSGTVALRPAQEAGQGREDSFHDVRLPPTSPPRPDSSADGMMSSYASAEDLLQGLFQKTDVGDSNTEADSDEGGDEEIDSKAEEFITKFYEQMKLQRLTSVTSDERMVELGV